MQEARYARTHKDPVRTLAQWGAATVSLLAVMAVFGCNSNRNAQATKSDAQLREAFKKPADINSVPPQFRAMAESARKGQAPPSVPNKPATPAVAPK